MNIRDQFSIILKQRGQAPKYFEFDRKKTKALFLLFPLMGLIFIFSTTAMVIYFSTLKAKFLMDRPKLEEDFQFQKNELQAKINDLEKKNQKLSQDIIFQEDFAFSSNQLIRVLPNSEDKTSDQLIEIDTKKLQLRNNEYVATFNITNQSVIQKVSGYFFTILKFNNVFQIYPKKNIPFNSLTFRDGEYFSTSRFRPVKINFKKLDLMTKAELIVHVFSTNGDLIHSSTETLEIRNE